jgi:hypothetical protein
LNLSGTAASSNRIGNLALTGNLSTGTSFANAGTISVSGTSSLGGSITSTGAQTYTGNATLAANLVTLTTTISNITFSGSVTGLTSARDLTASIGTGTITINTNSNIGALSVTGNLVLNQNFSGASICRASGPITTLRNLQWVTQSGLIAPGSWLSTPTVSLAVPATMVSF